MVDIAALNRIADFGTTPCSKCHKIVGGKSRQGMIVSPKETSSPNNLPSERKGLMLAANAPKYSPANGRDQVIH
jgi:hypothetical protein